MAKLTRAGMQTGEFVYASVNRIPERAIRSMCGVASQSLTQLMASHRC